MDDCLFQTLIKRAQGYINSRPLVWDPVKSQSISPADFLGTGSSYLVGPQIGGGGSFRETGEQTAAGRKGLDECLESF